MADGCSLLQALHNSNQSNYDIWLLNNPVSTQWQGWCQTFSHIGLEEKRMSNESEPVLHSEIQA